MIARRRFDEIVRLLNSNSAVAILGPRQVGKTTLALEIAASRAAVYVDLESPEDRAKLSDPLAYLRLHADKLVVLDEIHRMPHLFQTLRGLIDEGRRHGNRNGRFIVLGSASVDLLRQSSESLAGRIAYVELHPLDLLEVGAPNSDRLWLRGGFPDSFLAHSDPMSLSWRWDFVRTYLERDVPQFGIRVPAETLRRFWLMLAHLHGGLLNVSEIARSLGVDNKSVGRYLDLLVDLLLARRVEPWHANVSKRLVKSPKVFVRDSGLLHALLGIDSNESLLGHPKAGLSWEGFVIENIASAAPRHAEIHFYRTAAGAEIDCLVTIGGQLWAVEVRRSLAPKAERGFHSACADLQPQRRMVIYPGQERYPLADGVEAIPLGAALSELAALTT
jgi:predicted AAA+ superfamily ATPase